MSKFWNDNFTDFQECLQREHTRASHHLREGQCTTKLDRCFIRWGVEFSDFGRVVCAAEGKLSDDRESDHLMICLNIGSLWVPTK